MTTYTWTDNAMQGGGACDVDKVNDSLMHLKYDNVSPQDGKVPYSVNSGTVNASGYADFISKLDNTNFKALSTTTPYIITYPDGSQESTNADYTATISSVDGESVVVKEKGQNPAAVKLGYQSNDNIIPAMTANSSGGWTASAQSPYASSVAYMACDGADGNGHCYDGYTATWWKLLKDSGTFLTKRIAISANNTSYAMQNFNIKDQSGSLLLAVTGATWTQYVDNLYDLPAVFTGSGIIIENLTSYNGSGGIFEINEVKILQYYTGNSVTEDIKAPTSPIDGDYWLDTSAKPYKPYKRVSGAWVSTQFVKLGKVNKTGGVMGTPVSFAFNGSFIGTAGSESDIGCEYIQNTTGTGKILKKRAF